MSPLKIAIAGLGTVGSATLRLLQENADVIAARAGRPVIVTAVSARDKTRTRNCNLKGITWIDDPLKLTSMPEIDVVVELIGGIDGIARKLCEAALTNGKHVVTANKAMLATHGSSLASLAEKHGKSLMYEAAVAGGIPVIKAMREAMAGNKMQLVQGIMNGTCNYILTQMYQNKLDFADALKGAQDKGYAEADPSMDIDGDDTAHKLAILSALAFGIPPDLSTVRIEGIRQLKPLDLQSAEELGCRIKLLGVTRFVENTLEQRVSPCLVPISSPLASIDGVLNAVLLRGDAVGDIMLAGRGAGGEATSSSVVSDISDLARGYTGLPFILPITQLKQAKAMPEDKRVSGWYIRIHVNEQVGVVADIAAILRDEKISIESLLQHGHSQKETVPIIITTHAVSEAAMICAKNKIAKLAAVIEEPCCLRIENA